jgi:hypothetical protein
MKPHVSVYERIEYSFGYGTWCWGKLWVGFCTCLMSIFLEGKYKGLLATLGLCKFVINVMLFIVLSWFSFLWIDLIVLEVHNKEREMIRWIIQSYGKEVSWKSSVLPLGRQVKELHFIERCPNNVWRESRDHPNKSCLPVRKKNEASKHEASTDNFDWCDKRRYIVGLYVRT